MGRGVAWAVVAALTLWAGQPAASVFDVYGFGARGRGMGNAQVAAADDHTATFYNPAGLTRNKRVMVGVGLLLTQPALRIDRRPSAPHQAATQATLPDAFAGLHVGAVFPLGGLIDNRVALGVALYLPTLTLLKADAIDAQIPQFYRYQSLPDKFVVLASGAFQITDWLSVGAGVQVLATLDGGIGIDLEFANRRVTQRSVQVDIQPTAAPVAGVLLRPSRTLHIGASFRDALQLEYALPSALRIDQLLTLAIDIRGTVLYTPQVFTLGATYQIEPWHLLTSADVSWARWSQAPDPSPVFTLDVQGTLPEGLGLGERLDVGNGAPVRLRFRDVPVVRLGLEQQPHPQVHLRGGYTWRPSPAPVPTEAFNYIDTDAHVFALGGSFTFQDPLEVRRNPISIELVYQATVLTDLPVQKTAGPADPVGDYTAGGVVHSVGLGFRHAL